MPIVSIICYFLFAIDYFCCTRKPKSTNPFDLYQPKQQSLPNHIILQNKLNKEKNNPLSDPLAEFFTDNEQLP